MDKINILWTGGFDSTFRVCQLSLLEVEIQPYYISLRKKSEPYELTAISNITRFINANKAKKCNLLPLKIINFEEIRQDKQISYSYKVLHKEFEIGYQYDFLARFALQNDLILEIGFEADPDGRAHAIFDKYAVLKESSLALSGGGSIEYCEMDHDQSSEDCLNIFGRYRFGLPQFKMTKLETLELYKEIRYEIVIPLTWFCSYPVIGRPCGLCHPCEAVMKANMGFRLPFSSRILYRVFKANPVGRSIDKRLKYVYNKHWRKDNIYNHDE